MISPSIASLVRRFPLAVFYVVACSVTWLVTAPLWLPRFGIGTLPVLPYQHAFAALGPIVAAFIVTLFERGRPGAHGLTRSLFLWRGRLGWIALAVLAPLGMLVLAMIAARLKQGESVSFAGMALSREFPRFPVLGFFVYNVVTFGYGEETGWRGFALPRLQARYSAFAATLLLTMAWAVLVFAGPKHLGPAVPQQEG